MSLLRELPELDLGNHHRDTLKCEPTRNILLRPSRLPSEISALVDIVKCDSVEDIPGNILADAHLHRPWRAILS